MAMSSTSATARMIIVPQKKTYEVNVFEPIKKFIVQTYTTNLDDYLKSVEALNQLRNDALFRTSRQEKLAKLMRYYDQMTAIEAKIPITEGQIRIPYKWQDAFDKGIFGKSTLVISSGLYERLCVLFNVAAQASEIAANQPLDQEDGLKTAAKLYQLAAGAFSYVRDNSLTSTRNDCTSDFYPETLTVLMSVMLAQAQEIFYMKAVRDKMKELTISKLAAQCSDFYADAMKSIQNENVKELQKMWLQTLAGKQALYHGLSEYHKAAHASSEHNIGEEVARLTKSMELLKVASERGGKEFQVKSQAAAVQTAFEKAKKENDYVYHERIPDYKTLSPIERAAIAKMTPIKLPISEDFRDLFATMVPVTVNHGLQMFKAKKMEALNLEIGKLRQATDLLNTALAAWNLPAAIEDVAGSNKVPQSLLDKSQIIKDKGGIGKIDSMMAELPPLLQRNNEILAETKRCLEGEERSDVELKSQFADRWTRTPSRQLNESLYAEIKQYETIIENAVKANRVIESKYRQHRDGVQLLSKSPSEINSSLPAATPVAALQGTHVVKDLRRLMDEVEALKNVREVLESEMKNLDSDAIQARLITALQSSNSMDEHSIIQEELDSLVSPMRKQVRENIQEQERLLGFIERANSDFNREKGQNETGKMRDEMLKNLASASDGYNELYSHLNEGIKFYNDLTPILIKFQTKVNDFVFARDTEKKDLIKDIQENIVKQPTGSASRPPSRPPPPAPNAPGNGGGGASNPIPSTPPYPAYNPYFPQMPNAYNPYGYPPAAPSGQPAYPQQPYYPPYPK